MEHIDQYEELYRAWIGEKKQDVYYEKMHKGGFNWVAFLLSGLLLITRKMFVESIVLIVLIYLIKTVLGIVGAPIIVYFIIDLAPSLILGFTYYYLYRWHIKRKIEKYQRKGLSYEEQLQMARTCGGDKITIGVILMIIVEFILAAFLSLGMNTVLNLIHSGDNVTSDYDNTRYESNYDNYNYNNSNTDLDNNYYSNDNLDETNANSKSWDLDLFSLSYNENDWKEMTQEGYKALKYKNTENYLAYLSSENNNGLINVKTKSFQDNFEQQVKQQIESADENMTYLYLNWEDIDSRLYLCTVDCSISDTDTGAYAYITYYYCFSDSKIYCLMTTETQSDYSFENDARKVIDTIKNNSQI